MAAASPKSGVQAAEQWPWLFTLPVAVAVGLLLRGLLLDSKSIWLDEAMSLRVTLSGPQAWLAGSAEGYHPPLYYAFLSAWVRLGQSPAILRLSSALLGILAIPLTYALARALASRTVALSAAWLVALSPLLVWYSQEFRSYSLLIVLALASSLALARLLTATRPVSRAGWWVLYVLATAAGFYTHYAMALALPLQLGLLLALLAQRRVQAGGGVAALLAWPAIAIAYLPWLTSPPARTFLAFALDQGGYPGMMITQRFGMSWQLAALASLAVTAAALALLLLLWREVRRRNLWPANYRSAPLRAALLILFLLLLVASVYPRAYSIKRLAVIAMPFVCIAIAWFWPLRRRLSGPLALIVTCSLVASLVNVVAMPKDDWRGAAQFLEAAAQPGDVVWVAPGYDNLPFAFYHGGRLPVTEINAVADADVDALAASGARVWLVYNDAPTRFLGIGPELEARLAGQLKQAQEWNGYRVRAVLFAPQ